MKHRIGSLCLIIALLAILGWYYAAPAIAQNRAALVVKNIDERSRNPYQATSFCTNPDFPSSGGCAAIFPIVPAGKRLVIEYVNAEFNSSVQPSANVTNLSTGHSYVLPTFARFGTNTGVSTPVLIYVEVGQQAAFAASGPVVAVHLTGYLIDLSQ